jgi:hypothetical protein
MERMLRCLALGSLLLCALLLLVPAGALACTLPVPQSWTKQTPDGAFELSSRVGETPRGPARLSLRDVRSGKTLWEHPLETGPDKQKTLLSMSGRYVALTNDFSSQFTVYGPGGEVQKVSLEPHLTPREKSKLPETSCGPQWLSAARFEDEVLVLVVLTGGMDLRMDEQPKDTTFRFDPKARQLTRQVPANHKSTAELIQAYKGSTEPAQRKRLVHELVDRSLDGTAGGDAELSRFWQELLRAPETQPKELALAVTGLGVIGTEAEVRALARLPAGPPERDLEILQVLQRRAPPEAEAFALRVLEERRGSELLRARAVVFLGDRGAQVAERTTTLALSDPSAQVRESGLRLLTRPPLTGRAVEQALPLCEAPEVKVSSLAADSLLRILRRVEGTERQQALKVLRDAKARGKLTGFPEGYVILAGVADLEKKRSEALALYRQGVKGFAELELPSGRKLLTSGLRLDAKLQLAFEAKAKGRKAELKKWAEEVLGDEHKNTLVCAPKPNEYAGKGPNACDNRRTAGDVARQLLESGRPAPPSRRR